MKTSNPMLKRIPLKRANKHFYDDHWWNRKKYICYAYFTTCSVGLFVLTDDARFNENVSINWSSNS